MVRQFIALQVAGLLLAACSAPSARGTGDLPPVTGLVATLEDETRPVEAGRLRWSTYWRLSWTPYPDATGYELQTVTSEGTSLKLKTLSDPVFRLQVAAGENAATLGLHGRQVQVQMQESQLGFRVRAIMSTGRRSGWSDAAAAGRAIGN